MKVNFIFITLTQVKLLSTLNIWTITIRNSTPIQFLTSNFKKMQEILNFLCLVQELGLLKKVGTFNVKITNNFCVSVHPVLFWISFNTFLESDQQRKSVDWRKREVFHLKSLLLTSLLKGSIIYYSFEKS